MWYILVNCPKPSDEMTHTNTSEHEPRGETGVKDSENNHTPWKTVQTKRSRLRGNNVENNTRDRLNQRDSHTTWTCSSNRLICAVKSTLQLGDRTSVQEVGKDSWFSPCWCGNALWKQRFTVVMWNWFGLHASVLCKHLPSHHLGKHYITRSATWGEYTSYTPARDHTHTSYAERWPPLLIRTPQP